MIYIFESRQSILMHKSKAHTSWINTATYSSDGRQIITSSKDCKSKIFSVDGYKLIHTIEDHENNVTSAQFYDNCDKIVTASFDKRVIIKDMKD